MRTKPFIFLRCAITLLALCTFSAEAVTNTAVIFSMKQFTGTSLNRRITVTPLDILQTDGTNVISGVPLVTQPVQGMATNWLWPSWYQVNLEGINKNWYIEVYETNGPLSAALISTNLVTRTGLGPFVSQVNAGSNIVVSPVPGKGVVTVSAPNVTSYAVSTNIARGQAEIAALNATNKLDLDLRTYVNDGDTNLWGELATIESEYIAAIAAATNATLATATDRTTAATNSLWSATDSRVTGSTNGLATVAYVDEVAASFQSATNGVNESQARIIAADEAMKATNTIAAASLTGTIDLARLSGITSNQIAAATDAAYRGGGQYIAAGTNIVATTNGATVTVNSAASGGGSAYDANPNFSSLSITGATTGSITFTNPLGFTVTLTADPTQDSDTNISFPSMLGVGGTNAAGPSWTLVETNWGVGILTNASNQLFLTNSGPSWTIEQGTNYGIQWYTNGTSLIASNSAASGGTATNAIANSSGNGTNTILWGQTTIGGGVVQEVYGTNWFLSYNDMALTANNQGLWWWFQGGPVWSDTGFGGSGSLLTNISGSNMVGTITATIIGTLTNNTTGSAGYATTAGSLTNSKNYIGTNGNISLASGAIVAADAGPTHVFHLYADGTAGATPGAGEIFGYFYGNAQGLTNAPTSILTSGQVATARLGSGAADSTMFLRGDQSWQKIEVGNTEFQTGTNALYTTKAVKTNAVLYGQLNLVSAMVNNPNGTNWQLSFGDAAVDINSTAETVKITGAGGLIAGGITAPKFFVTNSVATPPTPSATGGWLWNSNQVLYWITSTRTNLISDGR